MKKVITVHYGEIALKGKNRREFENLLIKNIKKSISKYNVGPVSKMDSRIIIECTEETDFEQVIKNLKCIFGIEWFSVSYELEKDLEHIKRFILGYCKEKNVLTPIKIETKRADKSFHLNSTQASIDIAEYLEENGIKMGVKENKTTIYVQILNKCAIISVDKTRGPGGLPVGSSGRVLVLLSGGIDSPVAAILMMKRGCSIDLIHFYQQATAEEASNSKILEIIEILKRYGFEGRVYLTPYHEFYKATFDSVPPRKELVVFRRFMLKVSNELAKEGRCLGIATGDNLSQVASQTLDNLYTTNSVSELPVYRPLLTYDKREIIKLAEEYGTFSESIKEYKDCCSIVSAKHPETKTKLEEIKKIEEKIKIEEIVAITLKKTDKINY